MGILNIVAIASQANREYLTTLSWMLKEQSISVHNLILQRGDSEKEFIDSIEQIDLVILVVSNRFLISSRAKTIFNTAMSGNVSLLLVLVDEEEGQLAVVPYKFPENANLIPLAKADDPALIEYIIVYNTVKRIPPSKPIRGLAAAEKIEFPLRHQIIVEMEQYRYTNTDTSALITQIGNLESISFTQFYPEIIPAREESLIRIYLHLSSALNRVKADFEQYGGFTDNGKETTVESSLPFRRGTRFTIIPLIEHASVTPVNAEVLWQDDFDTTILTIRPSPKAEEQGYISGNIRIFVGPLMVAEMPVNIRVGPKRIAQNANFKAASAKQYKKLFLSYSHKDKPVIQAIDRIYKLYPEIETYIDYKFLNSGEDWWDIVQEKIRVAEALQLFWSENSSVSDNVKKEWLYALQLPRPILPLIIGESKLSIPSELSHLHFEDFNRFLNRF